MIPAVVIGGERRIVDEDVTPRLRKHGLDVIDVFPMDKEMGDLPRDAEVFVLLTNMMSHRHNDFAKAEAERRGNVKVVYGSSKGSLLVRRLVAAGYPEVREPAPAPVAPKPAAVSNPRLPGGFWEAELVGSDMDENYLYVMLQIQNDPVYGGAVFTDVLISRADYAAGRGLDRVYDFVRTLGIPVGKTGKGVEEFRRSTDELWGRPVWFHAAPAGNGTRITYYEKSQWALKSAAQRRRRVPVAAAPPPPVTPVPVPVPPVTPVTPVREEEPMPSTSSLQLAPDTTRFRVESLYHQLLKVLAADPALTRDETVQRLHITASSSFSTTWATARKELGISSVRTGPVTIDRPVYEAACATLGVTPVEGTTLHRERKPPAPQLTILPPPPVAAAPKVEAPPQVEPPKDDLAEIREILALLRDEMVKRDIRQMVVTPEGVDFTRVVTVSGKMEF
jgi:hypothetical protein